MRTLFRLAIVLLVGYGVVYFFVLRGGGGEVVRVEVEEVRFEDVLDGGGAGDDRIMQDEIVDEGEVEDVDSGEGDEDLDVDDHDDVMLDEVADEGDLSTSLEMGIEEIGGLPAEFNLAVPFTSQAPHANWELPYQEACEEASAYMVAEYYAGRESGVIDAGVADAAILEVVAFQQDLIGDYLDTTAAETVQFIDMFYGVGARVVYDPAVDDIRAEIAAGRPVILPASGKDLENPFFSGDGPLYHMLVIKGYADGVFIVNDPGTYRGENYVYDEEVLMSAMGDWNGGAPANGGKVVIFTEK